MGTTKKTATTDALKESVTLAQVQMRAGLVGREAQVQGATLALLSGHHVLMIGPPGTAKSQLARTVAGALGASYFERLLTRFSAPEDLFGPVSLVGLQADRFCRNTAGWLPEAEIAFIDEVFKANASILNSLLALLNERVFHNDGASMPVPLRTAIAASNEYPESEELDALFDRFLFRYWVEYLQPADLTSLLTAKATHHANGAHVAPSLSVAQLDEARASVLEVDAAPVVDALGKVAWALRKEGIKVSDRRLVQSLDVVRAAAWLDGRTVADPEDLEPLADVLWSKHTERPQVVTEIARVAGSVLAEVQKLYDAIVTAHDAAMRVEISDAVALARCASAVEKTANGIKGKAKEMSLSPRSKAKVQSMLTDLRARYSSALAGSRTAHGLSIASPK